MTSFLPVQLGAASQVNADLGTPIGTINNMVDGFLAMLPLLAAALIVFIKHAGNDPPRPARSDPEGPHG